MSELTTTGSLNCFLGQSSTAPDSRWFDVHPKLGLSMIQHLYNRLDGAYPHWFSSNFASEAALTNWAESWVEAFEEEGISPKEASVGLKACRRRYQKPPSCAEFIQACKPFADPVPAYHEAIVGIEARRKGEWGVWSHPAVYWSAMLLSRDLMMQAYGQVKDRWAATLTAQLARGEWAEIPAPAPALPAPGKGTLSRADAARMLAEVGAIGVTKSARATHFDHKTWARKIMDRLAKGDKSLLDMQVANAKTALGIL